MLPLYAYKIVKKILAYGAKKGYAPNSWKDTKLTCNQHLAKAIGHIAKSMYEPIDEESGYLHLDHAICRLTMARALMKGGKDVSR